MNIYSTSVSNATLQLPLPTAQHGFKYSLLTACVNKYKSSVKLNGVITSPNYPGLYPHDTSCTYIFDGFGKQVMLNFTHFDVKGVPPL